MTRAPALTLAALALTALTACTDDPSTVNAPPTTPAVTTTSAAPSPSATGSGTATSSTSNCPVPGNKPAGGVAVVSAIVNGDQVTTQRETWEVDVNTPVRVAVIADTRDEVHVHTYDVKQATVPGCPTMLDFVANIPGTHEVELEGKHLLLFRIKVG